SRHSAFLAWCEAARLATTATQLTRTDVGRGEDAHDIRRLLLLRRAQLDDPNVRRELAAECGDPAPVGDLIFVVGGSAADPPEPLRDLLGWTLGGSPGFTGEVVEPVGGTGVGRVLRELAAAEGGSFAVHTPGADTTAARRHALALWTRLACGAPGTVRVLAVPGDPSLWPQVQLLRTLGARIGWLPLAPAGAPIPDPERQLLGGTAGVVELPVDRATVRAFLRPSRWTGGAADRDAVAAALHQAYLRRHGAHKQPGDPALRPFAQLPPALQDSNRAVVDDIPAKLAAAGLRLCALAAATWPATWPDEDTLNLLAELEHGRWNAERLLAGWEAGVRDTGRFLSPHLKPWTDLDEQAKDWDRDIVRDLPVALEQAGLGACRVARGQGR
ncbi:MAG TPA: RyR domain-containing protein, partial [Pseudonocardiaceae bacterium]|nr:RyR domain-containing protein [Pseudonocardiaceae bacterium]